MMYEVDKIYLASFWKFSYFHPVPRRTCLHSNQTKVQYHTVGSDTYGVGLVDGWMDGIAVTTRTDLNYFSLLLMLEQTHTGMNLRCLISGTPLKGP